MISVIVPVFNAEKYLCRCARSVSAQSFRDWELILVVDGATDNSEAIARKLAAQDPGRIKVTSIPNRGPSAARNLGLDMASGEYVFFLDADDSIHPQTLETLLEGLTRHGAGIATARTVKMRDGKEPLHAPLPERKQPEILSGEEAAEKVLYQTCRRLDASACGKLFRKELFENHRFPEGRRYEDLWLVPFLFLESAVVAAFDTGLYDYRLHESSFLHTPSPARKDALAATASISERMARVCPGLLPAARDRELSAAFNIWRLFVSKEVRKIARRQGWEGERREAVAECRTKIRRLGPGSLFNPKTRLKNKLGVLAVFFVTL